MNYSPLNDESETLKEGQVVRVDLGCHINGYVAHAGTTIVVSADPASKVDGEVADLIKGAWDTLQLAIRTLVFGKKNLDVTEMILKGAQQYGLEPYEGTYSHKHKHHVLDENTIIMNKKIPERREEPYEFEKGDVFGLDVFVTNGIGKAVLSEKRTTVFKRQLENTFQLKSKMARAFFNEVEEKFPSLPFSINAFENVTQAKMGVKHCVDNELLEPHEVTEIKEGNVARFTVTVAITQTGTSILCGNTLLQGDRYETSKSVEDEELKNLLALSMDMKEQKKRAKEAKKAAAAEEEKKE